MDVWSRPDPAEAILRANEAFYAAFVTRDMGAMDGIWSRRDDVTCIHPGWNALTSREDVIASWEAILSNPAQPRIVGGGARVMVAGETAIVICREFVAGAPLIATNVFIREDERWRLFHHQAGPVSQIDA